MSWIRRLRNALRPGRLGRDIDRELAFHVEERAEALEHEGLDPDEARRRARRQFGNAPLQAERTRDADVARWLDGLVRQLRLAVRSLRRTPGFTLAVVLTLTLGIGANAAIFSALDAVLLRPLPFPDADRLVRVTQVSEIGERDVAPVRLADWDRLNTTFGAITSYVTESVSDTTGEAPERVVRATVMPRFLEVWGVAPALGRGFTDAEHRLGGPPAILVSERYWRQRLGADPNVLERAVRMGDRSYAIVGVLPASFRFPERGVDWWVPQFVDAPWAQNRTFNSDRTIGRLLPGVTLQQAGADLVRLQDRLGEQYPKTDRGIAPRVVPLRETLVGSASWRS